MSERRVERVLIAERGGAGMALLRAVEAGGREGVLLMSDQDAHQAWIDEVAYVVHVPNAQDGSWPDWFKVASVTLDAGCDAVLPSLPSLAGHVGLAERLSAMNCGELGPGREGLSLAADWVGFLDLARSKGVRVVPAIDLGDDLERAVSEAEAWLQRWGAPAWLRIRLPDGGVETLRIRAADSARAELEAVFSRGRLSLLHQPPNARIIEVPVIGDGEGTVVALGDREVTIWRDGQGVLVEAPAADLSEALRTTMAEGAVAVLSAVRWRGLASVTFAITADGRGFMRELKPGMMPWYAATEAAYGLDQLDALIRLAEGQALEWRQEDVVPSGAAMLLRLFVEGAAPLSEHVEIAPSSPRPDEDEPEDDEPRPGIGIASVSLPDDVTVDLPLFVGDHVLPGEELGTLLVTAPTRQSCIVRAKAALDHVDIGGVVHTGAFLAEVLSDAGYWRGPAGGEM